jgi:hypothetical protein
VVLLTDTGYAGSDVGGVGGGDGGGDDVAVGDGKR